MIKAFENHEIWFVTGAQLLYGGDAVVQVDGHSSAMVEGMNASGVLPIKVVYKGTANSSKEELRNDHHPEKRIPHRPHRG